MFILQIILTVIAWFRGWKWYALIPLTIGIITSLLMKYIFVNPSNAINMKLFASIITVVINLVLLLLCIIKKPIKGQKEDESTVVTEDIENNDEMKQPEPDSDTVKTIDKEVNEEQIDNNEKESISCAAPLQVTGTKQYYYAKGRKKKGPYTEDELVKLKLKPETLIWTEGLNKWQPLSDFDGLIKTPPPLPIEILSSRTNPRKRLSVSLVLLVLLLGGSFISTYFIMENRKTTYLKLIDDEIENIFNGKITLCEGEEYFTRGELRPVSEPIKSPGKSEDSYNEELAKYKEDKQSGAIERFHSEGISFEYLKLIRRNSGFRIERLYSADMVYFYQATVRYGSNPPRRLVTPEVAYDLSYRGIIEENSECLTEGLSDKESYLRRLNNKYFYITYKRSGKLSGGWRGTDYYRVYYERSYDEFDIEEGYSINEDFKKILAMFGGISIILSVLIYILNPFKW